MGLYYPFLGGGRTCNQVTTPLVYDESLSYEQQIACIFGKLSEIGESYVSATEFDDYKGKAAADQEKQTGELEGYADAAVSALDKKLRKLISDLQVGMMLWNVTVGEYTGNVQAMRDMFNDVTVHSITVDTLAGLGMTVDELADCGLNVRGLAVFSGYLVGDGFVPEGIMYKGSPSADGKLTRAILANGEVRDGYFVNGG